MNRLADMQCVRGEDGAAKLTAESVDALLAELGHDWQVTDGRRLRREYAFDDFASALAYVNRVGAMAEEQSHHPDLHLSWGKVIVEVWTHTVDGLTESDFVFAAKAERLFG